MRIACIVWAQELITERTCSLTDILPIIVTPRIFKEDTRVMSEIQTRIQMLHDLANDCGFVALKRAVYSYVLQSAILFYQFCPSVFKRMGISSQFLTMW